MPLDERDAKFEKALSRHFRGECPDAETLAAYHERALAPEEMVEWKKHIATCGNCQEILAQLESTEHIPVETEANELVAAFPLDQAAMRRIAMAQTVSEGRQHGVTRQADHAAAGGPPIQLRRTRAWKWAAPAGAIAAGLLVWLSISELKRPVVTPQAPVQVAERHPEAAPETQEEAGRTRALSKSLNELTANKPAKPESHASIGLKAPATKVQRTPNQPLAKTERADGKENGRQIVDRPAEEAPRKAEAKERARLKDEIASNNTAPPAATSKSIGAVTESVQVQTESESRVGTPAPAPPLPVPAAQAQDQKKNAAAGVLAQQEISGGPRSGYQRDAHLMDADSSRLHTVVSADGKRVWRLEPNGQILLFTGKGTGWQAQLSGVNVDLTAGSAPSERVCWVVGREGTVLLTIDGGKHWRKVSTPIRGDLGGVAATDAAHARVWDAANHLSYETSDGGVTWKQLTTP